MPRQDDLRVHFGGAGDGGIEVVDFKPQEHAVAIGLVVPITDRPVVVFDLRGCLLSGQTAFLRRCRR
jgi:hypothetical protein